MRPSLQTASPDQRSSSLPTRKLNRFSLVDYFETIMLGMVYRYYVSTALRESFNEKRQSVLSGSA